MPPGAHDGAKNRTTIERGSAPATFSWPVLVIGRPALTDSRPEELTLATCELPPPSSRTKPADAAWASGGPMTEPQSSAPATRAAVRHRLVICIFLPPEVVRPHPVLVRSGPAVCSTRCGWQLAADRSPPGPRLLHRIAARR